MPGFFRILLVSVLIASVLNLSARAEQDCVSLADQLAQSGRVALDGVHFDFDRALLRPDSIPILLAAREVILAGAGSWIIEGHTDNVGSVDYNQRLSRERAEAVVEWLVANGVGPDRLSAQGYGPDRPVADNASESGRALNRRVELVAADRAAESAGLARRQALCSEIAETAVIGEDEELDGEATISGPETAVAGSEIEVHWEGPDHANDYITVVEVDAPDGNSRGWSATRNGSPARLAVPDRPGQYELRYMLGGAGRTLARQAIEVTPANASLDGPEQVPAGSAFAVEWTGPDNPNDYITIVPPDAREQSYLSYHYSRNASPAALRAPDQPGSYEVRYVTGQSNKVLARQPIEVVAVSASVSGPPQAGAGSTIEVSWTGPDNSGDYLTIVPADAPDHQYLDYAHTRDGSPLGLRAPNFPGPHELRYVSGQSTVLARQAIELTEISASLSGPGEIVAGSTFDVDWTGPANQGDFVTIVQVDAADGSYLSYSYATSGTPASLRAPNQAGSYELRYVTGRGNRVLARQAVTVTAGGE